MLLNRLNQPKGWLLLALLFLVACGGSGGATAVPATSAPTDTGPAESDTAVDAPITEVAEEPTAATERFPADKYADFEIITLLPRDAIPAIDNPQFLTIAQADEFYDPDELVIGVAFNGDARAYSVPFLSNHEIVNDTVGGVKIAVTW